MPSAIGAQAVVLIRRDLPRAGLEGDGVEVDPRHPGADVRAVADFVERVGARQRLDRRRHQRAVDVFRRRGFGFHDVAFARDGERSNRKQRQRHEEGVVAAPAARPVVDDDDLAPVDVSASAAAAGPLASVTVTIREPFGPTAYVRVSPPTRWTFTSRPTLRKRSFSSWRMNLRSPSLHDRTAAFLDDGAVALAPFAPLAANVVELARIAVDAVGLAATALLLAQVLAALPLILLQGAAVLALLLLYAAALLMLPLLQGAAVLALLLLQVPPLTPAFAARQIRVTLLLLAQILPLLLLLRLERPAVLLLVPLLVAALVAPNFLPLLLLLALILPQILALMPLLALLLLVLFFILILRLSDGGERNRDRANRCKQSQSGNQGSHQQCELELHRLSCVCACG